MKKLWILLLLPAFAFAQKKDAVFKKLADYTCDCANKKPELTETAVGLCIFEALGKLTDKEKKIIDFSDDDKSGSLDKVAENIGMSMAMVCPEVFTKMQGSTDTDQTVEEPRADSFFTGTLESVVTNQFKSFTLIDEKGEKKEFIWLFSFEGDSMFIKNKITKGDKLEIHYNENEFFDVKSNSYKTFNEITSAKLL